MLTEGLLFGVPANTAAIPHPVLAPWIPHHAGLKKVICSELVHVQRLDNSEWPAVDGPSTSNSQTPQKRRRKERRLDGEGTCEVLTSGYHMAVVIHQLVIATVTYPGHTQDQARRNSRMTGKPWRPCPYCRSCGKLMAAEGGW